MTKERAYFEASVLQEHGRLCPDHVPEVYHFDRTMCLIGMRYIEPPHIILRKGFIAGIEYPLLADHMSEYMAQTLFYTSLLYLTTTDHKSAGKKLLYSTSVSKRSPVHMITSCMKQHQYGIIMKSFDTLAVDV